MVIDRDFDIVEIPVEGVAAYWLSLKKLVGGKKNLKLLEEEAAYTSEPYIRYLLELALSSLEDSQLERLAMVRREAALGRLERSLAVMSMALRDMAGGDNPRKTLSAMTACFAQPPVKEHKAIEMSKELMGLGANPGERPAYFNIHHRMKPDRLLVALYFYLVWCRKEGKMAMAPFQEFIESPYFTEGLSLVVDGFEPRFIDRRLATHRKAIVDEAGFKMSMSVDLCLGVRSRMGYDELFRMAGAYMPE